MKKLTDKELKEFWEWCGLIFKTYRASVSNSCEAMCLDLPPVGWYDQEGKLVSFKVVPKLDLNNLFKYAVPKLRGLSEVNTLQDIEFHWQGKNISDIVECNLIFDEAQFDGEEEDSTLALYQAIQKARIKYGK